MDKKLNWFYQISISMILLFISFNILVKSVIWTFALDKKKLREGYNYEIVLKKNDRSVKHKYTTETKQKILNRVDYLLTPALTMLFVVVAVKLIKIPGIFEENN